MPLVQHSRNGATYVLLRDDEMPALNPQEVLHTLELQKYTSLPETPAREFLRGRYGLKVLIQESIKNPMNEIFIDADEFGKPILSGHPDVFCTISDSGEYTAVALSKNIPVGIDVEQVKDRHPALLRHISQHDERDALEGTYSPEILPLFLWTCKEAAAKADLYIHALKTYKVSVEEGIRVVRSSNSWSIEVIQMGSYIVALATAE